MLQLSSFAEDKFFKSVLPIIVDFRLGLNVFLSCNYNFFFVITSLFTKLSSQKTAKGRIALRFKVPPAHLPTTLDGGRVLVEASHCRFLLLNVKQNASETNFLWS